MVGSMEPMESCGLSRQICYNIFQGLVEQINPWIFEDDGQDIS